MTTAIYSVNGWGDVPAATEEEKEVACAAKAGVTRVNLSETYNHLKRRLLALPNVKAVTFLSLEDVEVVTHNGHKFCFGSYEGTFEAMQGFVAGFEAAQKVIG